MSRALEMQLGAMAERAANLDPPEDPAAALDLLGAIFHADRELMALAERVSEAFQSSYARSRLQHPGVPLRGVIRGGWEPDPDDPDDPDDPPPDDDRGGP